MIYNDGDTIVAAATPTGGALCVVRLSGEQAIAIADRVFRGRKSLLQARTATVHYGRIVDGDEVVDDVLLSLFRSPHSYTGEDAVEISAHGSAYIVSEIIRLFCSSGARLAAAGEFSARALAAGRMDLSQAEAVPSEVSSADRLQNIIQSD